MSWIVYREDMNKFYKFDTKAEANKYYNELIKIMKYDDFKEGTSIFVSQIKNCSIKESGKIKQRGYF